MPLVFAKNAPGALGFSGIAVHASVHAASLFLGASPLTRAHSTWPGAAEVAAALIVQAWLTLCLQSTFTLSYTVAGLGVVSFRVRSSRPLSGRVVVR